MQQKESFNANNNFIEGSIPKQFLMCIELKLINLAENSLKGTLPSEFGNMDNLQIINLSQNEISGRIPSELFHSVKLESLLLQSNKLTGAIPSQIANLQNLTTMSVSHNELKGKIPIELESLQNIQRIHLHNNKFTGAAPSLQNSFTNLDYIADCGTPSFHLTEPLTCTTCTTCCNSEEMCQLVYKPPFPIIYITVISFLSIPITFILFFIHVKPFKHRDPQGLYADDSVYCFIFSTNWKAKFIFFTTVILQFLLFYTYLDASDFRKDYTAWQFSYHCAENSLDCTSVNTRTYFGWSIFAIVTTVYLGHDIVTSVLQIYQSVILKSMPLLLSGFIILGLTLCALITSIVYNTALAVTDTDLIMNAVILLFINDMDEKILMVMDGMHPVWTKEILDEVDSRISEISGGV